MCFCRISMILLFSLTSMAMDLPRGIESDREGLIYRKKDIKVAYENLKIAIKIGDKKEVQRVLAQEIAPELIKNKGKSLITRAIDVGNKDIIESIFNAQPPVELVCKIFHKALREVEKKDVHRMTLEAFLTSTYKKKKEVLDSHRNNCLCPLVIAAKKGEKKLVVDFVNAGADVNLPNFDVPSNLSHPIMRSVIGLVIQQQPLHSNDISEFLLEQGAVLNDFEKQTNLLTEFLAIQKVQKERSTSSLPSARSTTWSPAK